jgi:hypothetical protein
MATEFDNECFFIAPIGKDESEIKKRSDAVRDWVVTPAAKAAADLETVRADDVGEPGQITAQAIQHCLKAKAAVADLTEGNPNVYYELSVRHGAQLPVVLIAEEGTPLPFDISQSRVIFFDHKDLASAGKAKEQLQGQIEASLTGTPDNPISDGMRLAELQAGNVEEQTLAVVLDRLQRLSHAAEHIDALLQRTEQRQAGRSWQHYAVPTLRGQVVSPGAHEAPVVTNWRVVGDDGTEYEFARDDLSSSEKAEIQAEQEQDREPIDEDFKTEDQQ